MSKFITAIVALACMAPSMAINAIHQYEHTPGPMAWPLAGAAVLSVLLAGCSPFAMERAFKDRRFLALAAAVVAFVVCAAYNLSSAVGAASVARSEVSGARAADNRRAELLTGQLAQAEKSRAALAATAAEQTPEMVDKSLQALRQSAIWTRSKECAEATLDESRTFCAGYARSLAMRDAASKVAELDAQIAGLKAQVLAATGAAAGQPADPQAENIGAALALVGAHAETRKIGQGLNLWFALTIEVLGSLGPIVLAHAFGRDEPERKKGAIHRPQVELRPFEPAPTVEALTYETGDADRQEEAEDEAVLHGDGPSNVVRMTPRSEAKNAGSGEPSVYDQGDGASDGAPALHAAVREWLRLYTAPTSDGSLKASDAWISFCGAPCGAPFRDGAPRAFYQALKQALLVCERRRSKDGWVYHRIALVSHQEEAAE